MITHIELPNDSPFLTCPRCGWKVILIFVDPDNQEMAWAKRPEIVYCHNCGKRLEASEDEGAEVE